MIDKEEFTELLPEQSEACFSLFIPLANGPDEAEKNRIRLKNMAKSVEEQVAEYADLPVDKAQLLEPLEALMANGRLPDANDSKGAALFLKNGDTHLHFLPYRVPERIVVDQQFYIKPLLPLLTEETELFLLTLSQNEVSLYHATPEHLERKSPEGLPESIAEALAYDDPEKRQQYHTSTSAPQASGQQPAAFHTHHPDDEKKSRLRRFCQQVDESVSAYLSSFNEGQTPLMLAGVDYLLAIYREVNNYSHLRDEEIQGNVEHFSPAELQEQVATVVKNKHLQVNKQALDRFDQLQGSELTSTDFAEIVAAAHYGRIETLFVAQDSEQWGTFNVQTGQVALTEATSESAESYELTNFASRHTLLNSGTAYLLPAEVMPGSSKLAAIFRYSPNS